MSFVCPYSGTCLFKETGASIRNVERDIVQEDTLIFKHDWNNTMYCYNVIVHFDNRFLIMAMMLEQQLSLQVLIWGNRISGTICCQTVSSF